METNQALEQQLKQLNDDIARLDETLKLKETQYLELSKQYTYVFTFVFMNRSLRKM